MTKYQVQFTLPVNNPVNNVLMRRVKGELFFEVPINHPNAHNMGLAELIAGGELSKLLALSTPLNNTERDVEHGTELSRDPLDPPKKLDLRRP